MPIFWKRGGNMKAVENGFVVCCPKCGYRATVSSIGIHSLHCDNCKHDFAGWVVGGYVVTHETNGVDITNCIERFDACRNKLKELSLLSKADAVVKNEQTDDQTM